MLNRSANGEGLQTQQSKHAGLAFFVRRIGLERVLSPRPHPLLAPLPFFARVKNAPGCVNGMRMKALDADDSAEQPITVFFRRHNVIVGSGAS